MNNINLFSPLSDQEEVFHPLETQVSEPLSFLRELVQNAIDAGSAKVEISCLFEADLPGAPSRPGDDASDEVGTAVIRVADLGQGMNRNVIDSHLTRLWSSEKEGDPTKLGRFGIGFTSIFAIQPDAVCVDTGRYDESWRLVFRPDRTFTRVRLSQPIEGTTVRLWKAMTRGDFDVLEADVRRTLHNDCPHLEVSLLYQGKRLGAPIDAAALDSSIKAAVFEQQAFIVVGFTQDGAADTASFYNRGLTLLVRPSEFPGISYKISSPRLEPTLGRGAVMTDLHYQALLAIVQRLLSGPLVDELLQRLDAGLRQEIAEPELQALQRRLAQVLRAEFELPKAWTGRMVARSPHGQLFTLLACQEAARQSRLFEVSHPSPLSAAACGSGQIVLEDWQDALLLALCPGGPPRLEQVLILPLAMKEPEQTSWTADEALRAATLALLKAAAVPVDGVELGYLDYPGSGVGSLLAVVQARPFTVSKRAGALPRDQIWPRRTSREVSKPAGHARSTWVLNVDHPTLKALLPLSVHEPELAAYSLIKLCLHGGPLTSELDSELLALAMIKRCQRQESPLTERLIASLTAAGEIDSPGAFTVNPLMAREKIRRARFPNPLHYVLDLVQAAAQKGATHISFRFSAGNMQMHFDGKPFEHGDFEDLYASLLHRKAGPDAEARRLLATGLCTALQVDPAFIQVESGNTCVELRPGHPDRFTTFERPAGLTRIRLEQRLGLGMIKRYVDHLGGQLTEELLLQERCVHARIAITIDGRLISQGHALSDVTPWQKFAVGELAGAIGITPVTAAKPTDRGIDPAPEMTLSPTLLRLVQGGVWVDTQLPIELAPGFRGLAESPTFLIDFSAGHVVQGPEYSAALRAVAAAQVELLCTLCRRYLTESSGDSVESTQPALPLSHLRALLRGLLFRLGGLAPILRWAQISLQHFPPDTIAEGNPGWPVQVPDGVALVEVPIFPCTTGEVVTLSQLLFDFVEHKTIAYSAYRSRDVDPERSLVLHIAEPSSEALLRGLFGEALECRDAAAKQKWEREHRRVAWRRHAYRPRLSSQMLLLRVPLESSSITGELGLEPQRIPRVPWKRRLSQPATLRLIFVKDGCLLFEKTIPFPVPDVTVVVAGELNPRYLLDEALHGARLIPILDAVWSSLPALIEQLIRLGTELPTAQDGSPRFARDDETLAWWALVMRRLLMLTLSPGARQAAEHALDIPRRSGGESVDGLFRPNPLWIQLRELPIFEALDGTSLRPSDLEAAAARCGYLAVLCSTHVLHPKRLESWAALCSVELAPAEVWSEDHTLPPRQETTPSLGAEAPPFILWLAPCEHLLRDVLLQQMPPMTHIIDAEPWLRAKMADSASRSQLRATLTLPEECELFVPLSGIAGMLGVVNDFGLRGREQEPRLAVALVREQRSLGSEELWLPGGQFLSAVADHPQLERTSDQLDIADNAAIATVRRALCTALPELLALLASRPLPFSPLCRMLLLEAVTALFPRPVFRQAYDRLRLCARPGEVLSAEADYAALLRLAVATSRERVEAVLEYHLAQAGPLSVRRVTRDVVHCETNSWLSSASAPEDLDDGSAPVPPPGAMAWLDSLYSEGANLPMSERCLRLLPVLATAPLLMTATGSPLRFAEVIADFRQHGNVLYSASQVMTSPAQQRPVILDPGTGLHRILQCLFGMDNVREEVTAAHPPPPALGLDAASSVVAAPGHQGSPSEHSLDDRLLAALAKELRAVTAKNPEIFDDAVLSWLRIDDSVQSSAVLFSGPHCLINARHPAVQLVLRRFAVDAQSVRFLASAIHTALTARMGLGTDEEIAHFQHHLAVRALAESIHQLVRS